MLRIIALLILILMIQTRFEETVVANGESIFLKHVSSQIDTCFQGDSLDNEGYAFDNDVQLFSSVGSVVQYLACHRPIKVERLLETLPSNTASIILIGCLRI